MPKILVIEDQEGPFDNFEMIFQRMGLGDSITRARWYTEAERMIQSEQQYDVIFLDHRMPYEDPGCTDGMPTFEEFCRTLKNIGYGLLPLIREKQPQAVVIGTSSLSSEEIGRFEQPDKKLVKIQMFEDLEPLLRSLL